MVHTMLGVHPVSHEVIPKNEENTSYIIKLCHCFVVCYSVYSFHTAPFSFLSVFVDENAARSHCSAFK